MDIAPQGHTSEMWGAIARAKEDKAHGQTVVFQNAEYEAMWAPEQGPALEPHQQRAAGVKAKSHFAGGVEAYHPASSFAFEEQYHTFNAYGFAADPSNNGSQSVQTDAHGPGMAMRAGVVGDVDKWAEARGGSVYSNRGALESKMEEQRRRLIAHKLKKRQEEEEYLRL